MMCAVIHPHYNHILGFGSTELKMNPALTPPSLPLYPPPSFSVCPSFCPRLSGGLETAPKCGGDGAIQGQIALWTW